MSPGFRPSALVAASLMLTLTISVLVGFSVLPPEWFFGAGAIAALGSAAWFAWVRRRPPAEGEASEAEHAASSVADHDPAAAADGPPATPGRGVPNNPLIVVGGTILLVLVGCAVITSLINLWPSVDRGTLMSAQGTQPLHPEMRSAVNLVFGLVPVSVTQSTALLILVMIAGAGGSLIHVATSFADFVGNRRLYSSWVVWYVLRLLVGMTLALLLYFAIRGGFFSTSSQSADVNPYGIAALAGMAGLFSKQATDKLREVFETLFQVKQGQGDALRKDDLTPGTPTVAGIDPPRVQPGQTMFRLTVHGEHFVPASKVRVNGVDQATRFINSQALEATLPDSLLEKEGTLQVTVYTPPPGGGQSSPPAVLGVSAGTAAAAVQADPAAPSPTPKPPGPP